MASRKPEELLCKAFVQMTGYWRNQRRFNGILLHIPNGQRAGRDTLSRKIAGGIDRALGAIPGAPDYIILDSGRAFCLEAKSDKGRQSEHQVSFEGQCKLARVPYGIFRTVEEAEALLTEWGVLLTFYQVENGGQK